MNPINEGIQQYIKMTSYNDSNEFQYEMASYLQTLNMFEKQLSEKILSINEIIQYAIDFYPPRFIRAKYAPKICFVINKYLNLFLKYQSLRFSRYQQVMDAVKETKQMLSDYMAKNIQADIDIWDYIAFIFSKTDKHLHKLEFKLKSLYYYIQNLENIEKTPTYSEVEMFREMKELVPDVDLINGFIHQNKFDLMFECYVETNSQLQTNFNRVIHVYSKQNNSTNEINNQTKPKENVSVNDHNISRLILNNFNFFIEAVKQKTSQTKKNKNKVSVDFHYCNDTESNRNKQTKFDLKLFDKLVNLIYTKFTGPDNGNKKMFIILRCAALRYICNKYYIIHSKEWLENPSQVYFDNIAKIVNKTPRELLISSDIIPSKYNDISFDKLLLRDDFLNASSHIFSIQFYTCPIDIWKEVYISIVSSVDATNKFTNVSSKHSKIAFDDFFTILLPIFSSAQLTCPNALNSLLSSFIYTKKQNSLEIASTTILALLKIIETKI